MSLQRLPGLRTPRKGSGGSQRTNSVFLAGGAGAVQQLQARSDPLGSLPSNRGPPSLTSGACSFIGVNKTAESTAPSFLDTVLYCPELWKINSS